MVAKNSAQTVHLKWNIGAGVGFQASKLKRKKKFRSGCRCESGEVKMAPGMESQASHFKWKIAYRADAQNIKLNNNSWFYYSLFLGESVGVHKFICIRQSTLSIFGNQLIVFFFFLLEQSTPVTSAERNEPQRRRRKWTELLGAHRKKFTELSECRNIKRRFWDIIREWKITAMSSWLAGSDETNVADRKFYLEVDCKRLW